MLADRDIENLDEDEEDGGYIEMDLGLGVLEERRDGESESDTENESRDESTDDMVDETEGGVALESDVLGKLMGRKPQGAGQVGIQVVESVS